MKLLNIGNSQILNYTVRFYKNIRSLIFRICKIKTFGVRALIFNEKGEFLLVHHTYCIGWYTPGGALNYNETPLEALRRELFEEIGITIDHDPVLFSIYLNKNEYYNDFCVLYIIENYKGTVFIKDTKEISNINWFSFNKLPKNLTPSTLKRLKEYYKK